MVLVKNWTFLQLFTLGKTELEKLFSDVLDRLIPFLQCKNINLKRSQNLYFPKGFFHCFGQKFVISSTFRFSQNRPR